MTYQNTFEKCFYTQAYFGVFSVAVEMLLILVIEIISAFENYMLKMSHIHGYQKSATWLIFFSLDTVKPFYDTVQHNAVLHIVW